MTDVLYLYNFTIQTFKFFQTNSRKDKNVGACKMSIKSSYVALILSNLMLTVPQRESLTRITMTYDDCVGYFWPGLA